MQHRLFINKAFLGSQWVASDNLAATNVINPATEQVIGQVPNLSEAQIKQSIIHSTTGFAEWSALPAHKRSLLLQRWHALIEQNIGTLSTIMTMEEGKPLAEAEAEIRYASSFVSWFAAEARRVTGLVLPEMVPGQEMHITYAPVGVTAAITPWNFPAAMITRKAAAALAAGCSIIIKPAEQTPFSALALAALAEEAGIPGHALQIITGDPAMIGSILTASPTVRKISFTGSTEIGKLLMRQSADTLKRLSLELGGNAPFIICADANLTHSLECLFAAKGRNNGQTCVSPNRLLVHRSHQTQIETSINAKLAALTIGNGLEAATDVGPLIDNAAVVKIESLVADALKQGAKLLCGGTRLSGPGYFFYPTLLSSVTANMQIAQQEIFGPVYAIQYFDTLEQAITLANATAFGLVAYAYTTNLETYHRLAKELAFGMIALNTASISFDQTAFGGIKESGFGREGSVLGIYEYLQSKTIVGNPYAR